MAMNTIEEVIYHAASELDDPQARAAFLDRACGTQGDLRARIEALLRAELQADQFLAEDPLELGRLAAGRPDPFEALREEPAGTVIGRYKLLEKIGEGGMGVVYMAEQEEPLRRRVALKIIKLGMDTKQVVARFEAERQALALMDHPNIARVLDAGATDTGRPFFVMELVQGVPITEFCDQNRLSAQERIRLFIPVCQAIQSAHQKGIIHRDLKPTNILVTLNAGVPHPMVIDFGVAKATNQKLTEKTVFTNYATMIGTPAYMSPEQAEMSRLDVDTRTDIYGLGVLLYELLTGTTPFPDKRLRSVGYQEMQRIILEEQPERPSTRMRRTQTLGKSLSARSTLHAPRSTDLDWIVMKCLEKDRARRYETANGLAMDLQRHLNNEPVVARPPSKLYRFQKLVRRNKLVFAAGALATVALLLGTALASWQAVRASRERDAKEVALRQAVALREQAQVTQREETRLREQAQAGQREQTRLREQAQAEAYASDMLLAQQAVAVNNFGRARKLLYRHRPVGKSDSDLRGWEWRYLWQQCTSDALARVWQATNKISDLAVSQDGKWLAVGQNSDVTAVSVLEFVDRTTARLVTNLPAYRGTDVQVAFSPKGPLLAFNSSQYTATGVRGTIHVWNVETRQSLFERPVPHFCGGLAFSPDGSTLLVSVMNHRGTSDGQLLSLRVPDGTLLREYKVSIPIPDSLAVDPAFQLAAVGTERLQVVDLLTGKLRWTAPSEPGGFGNFIFARQGTILITADGLTNALFRVWDVGSGKPISRPVSLYHGMVMCLVMWPDGKTLASASGDGTIQMWDVSNPTELRSLGRPLRGQFGGVNGLALSSDSKTLLRGSWDGSVYAWDAAPAHRDPSPTVLNEVFDWQFAADGRSLLTVDPQGRVTRREGADFQVVTPLFDLGTNLVRLRDQAEFSEDGELLATARDGTVCVWEIQADAHRPRLVTPGMLVAHSFAPDSKLFILYNRANSSVEEWDLGTIQKLRSWPKVLPWRDMPLLALSSHGKYLLNASVDGDEASVNEDATGHSTPWKNLGLGALWNVDISPDGALCAFASLSGSAQILERTSPQLAVKVGHLQLPVWAVGFSEGNSRLITASDGSEALTLWDREGRELLGLQAAGYRFESPRFSADGRLLGCRNWENELYLWRAPSWAEIESVERTTPYSQRNYDGDQLARHTITTK
jgi:serine/threonine protein kinase/WD40 repeat protein